MNRKNRRALPRVHHGKLTHRLPTQACVLYVPHCGYVADFAPGRIQFFELPELAKVYSEDEASTAALTLRELTGLRVAIRPFYSHYRAH
jgi:hypothetical protein